MTPGGASAAPAAAAAPAPLEAAPASGDACTTNWSAARVRAARASSCGGAVATALAFAASTGDATTCAASPGTGAEGADGADGDADARASAGTSGAAGTAPNARAPCARAASTAPARSNGSAEHAKCALCPGWSSSRTRPGDHTSSRPEYPRSCSRR
jgi:hypothetical protein